MAKVASFSSRLKTLLDISGMSKAELARKSGVSKSSITHYIHGDWEGKQDALYAIANATDISEVWLMGYDVPMERTPVFSAKEVATVLKSLHLEQYLREHGYLFADNLEDGDIPDKREYCYEQATGRLWLLPAGKVHELEASIDRFTDFSIADLLRDAVEIPRTDPRYAAFPKD